MVATRGWNFRLVTAMATAGALLAFAPAVAQADEAQPIAEGPNTGKVGFTLGIDITTEYWYRGIFQATSGVIAQPYAEVSFALVDELGPIENVELFTGLWNSLHTRPKGTGNNASAWYEADWYVGVGADLPFGLSTSLSYVWLGNPNGGDSFAEEIIWDIAYDDSALWEEQIGIDGFSLQPYILFAFEIGGASDGNNAGGYVEFGVTPSYAILQDSAYPVTLSMPISAGFSLYDYYERSNGEAAFGFFDVGFEASTPLAFIPSDFGQWEAHIGLHIIMLQNTTLSNREGESIYAQAGVSMSY